jgi:hypothetical protein
MNDLKLLRELAQETPLPAPAELEAARARLAAAIAADPAAGRPGSVTIAEVTAPEADLSGGQPDGSLPSPAPKPVLAAVQLMYGGAVGTAVQLIAALVFIGDLNAYHLTVLGHHLNTAQVGHLRPLIVTLVIVVGLILIGLWLWMARAVRCGRRWARVLSTVLFGLATLELTGNQGVAQLLLAMLTWLTGLAAVWQLWRPASAAFFNRRRELR